MMADAASPARFRSRLLARERLIGTMLTLSSAAVAEILADAGFDWLFLDGEHGPLELRDLQAILQAVGDRTPCVVRVPAVDGVAIAKALDLGAAGIIAPQVNTPEQAERVVRSCRYPPEGTRGVGIARAQGYGMRFGGYVAEANKHVAVVVQAEHIQAVDNIERIAAVPGIDAVLIGPYDLSASMNLMGQVTHPSVVEAIERVTATCLAAGIPLGIFGVTSAAIKPFADRGYTLLVAGVDTMLLGEAARSALNDLRP